MIDPRVRLLGASLAKAKNALLTWEHQAPHDLGLAPGDPHAVGLNAAAEIGRRTLRLHDRVRVPIDVDGPGRRDLRRMKERPRQGDRQAPYRHIAEHGRGDAGDVDLVPVERERQHQREQVGSDQALDDQLHRWSRVVLAADHRPALRAVIARDSLRLGDLDASWRRSGCFEERLYPRFRLPARLRKLLAGDFRQDDTEAAERLATETLVIDPLNVRAASEQILAQRQRGAPEWRENVARLRQLIGRNPEAFLENTFDFANAGQWSEVVEILQDQVSGTETGQATIVAMESYLLAVALERRGQNGEAAQHFAAAGQLSPAFCFPSRSEEEPVLRRAMEANLKDTNAAYLLGCLLYDNQPENAIKAWEEARRRDDTFALTHRNLGLAYAQYEKNIPKAIASLEQAIALNPAEPRFCYELDAQYEAAGTPVARRLEMLTKHHDTVAKRDDAIIREIVVLTAAGRTDHALELLRGRRFRNWEGNSLSHSVYVDACVTHGLKLAADKKPREALAIYKAALEYPENLEVGRARRSPRTARVQFFIGTAHEALGDAVSARAAFEQAVKDAASAKVASGQSLAGRDGGDYESDYFGARALQKLGRTDEAKPVFKALVKTGEEQLAKGDGPDYFAKFGENTSERVRQANAHYLIGLGQLGLGEKKKADASFQQALELHPAHIGARELKLSEVDPETT